MLPGGMRKHDFSSTSLNFLMLFVDKQNGRHTTAYGSSSLFAAGPALDAEAPPPAPPEAPPPEEVRAPRLIHPLIYSPQELPPVVGAIITLFIPPAPCCQYSCCGLFSPRDLPHEQHLYSCNSCAE